MIYDGNNSIKNNDEILCELQMIKVRYRCNCKYNINNIHNIIYCNN